MGSLDLPPADALAPFAGGVLGALTTESESPSELQERILSSILLAVDPGSALVDDLEPWPVSEVDQAIEDRSLKVTLAHFVVVLELTMHPLPEGLEGHVEAYLGQLGVDEPYVSVCRDTAQDHLAALHADIIRNSWTTEETIRGVFHGRMLEEARSKLAYYGVGEDEEIARRWRGLGDCPAGSWGREVYEFYRYKGFPFPGEKHGIYEVGALHDWVHVLADYDTDPEGEIDVFAFIAATMDDPKGFIQFLFTLALFQNATVATVGGKKVLIARADTLDDPRAPDHLAESLRRATACTADVMGGADPFDRKDVPLDEVRGDWSIPANALARSGWRS